MNSEIEVKNEKKDYFAIATRIMLIFMAVLNMVLALINTNASNAPTFMGIAIVALLAERIKTIELLGGKFELEKVKNEIKTVEKMITDVEKTVWQNGKLSSKSLSVEGLTIIDPDDPHKNQFGGSSTNNGKEISAIITPKYGKKSSMCSINIEVKSIDKDKPLTGKVRIYLHPTFGKWQVHDLNVINGIAQESFESYGVFTIGAETDGGNTRLELDLSDVPGGTELFYKN
jgi:hypothetical protein